MFPRNDLDQWFSRVQKIVIVGIGNPIRRDDNIGVEIVNELEGKFLESTVLLIKSETVPESFIDPIIKFKPTHILIIDAALMNLTSGSVQLVESFGASGSSISTHVLPIQIFYEYLAKSTEAKIAALLIQPKDTSFGEGLTYELEITKRGLVKHLTEVIRSVFN